MDVSDFVDFASKTQGRQARYGKAWEEVPCVAITTTGLTFNAACTVLGIEVGKRIFLKLDRIRRVLLLKLVQNGEGETGSYKIQRNEHKADLTRPTLHVTSKDLAKTVADCRGRAYRARLEPQHPLFGRIIAVLLSDSNRSE